MTLRELVKHYLTLIAGVHQYLRAPVGAEPETILQEQLEQRENRWLSAVKRVVFENPTHPYCRMFKLADCTYDDLENSVRKRGLEPTLVGLRDSGIYLSHDELKGKIPIVRSGQEIPSDKLSLDNPDIKSGFQTTSGGSRSKGTRLPKGLHADSTGMLTTSSISER